MVLFDLDGTLWDSGDTVAESWNIAIEREGYDLKLSGDDIRSCMGKTMDEIADIHFAFLPPEKRYHLSRCCEVFENGYIEEHGGNLFEGVRETLALLRDAGVKMAVVSNCQEGYVPAFIKSMDMAEFFCDYEEWGRSGLLKADNIRLVIERNGEDKGIYVGDIQKDADAASAAGVPCIWAAYGFGTIEAPAGTISSFSELPAALKELGFMK